MKKALLILSCALLVVLPSHLCLAQEESKEGQEKSQQVNKEIKETSKEVAKESKKMFRETGKAGKSLWQGLKEGFKEGK